MAKTIINLGRQIAGLLRHHPEKKGLTVNKNGWSSTKLLCEALGIEIDSLDEVVDTNNKKRFEYSKDKKLIRAVQGHSLDVDVGLEKKTPPDELYHGTSLENKLYLTNSGISPMERIYVHLSENTSTAIQVGKRHGEPSILRVDTKQMHDDGYSFYQSRNGVWCTDYIPTKYFSVML